MTTIIDGCDYGPLAGLIGRWEGRRGLDISPSPDATDETSFHETLDCEAAGDVRNAQQQLLTIVRYHQQVFKGADGTQFHDQLGYFCWDSSSGVISHSFVIPRAVAVVAGGKVLQQDGEKYTIRLTAKAGDAQWGISQSGFMHDHARTVAFTHTIVLHGDTLHYEAKTELAIYDRQFDHIDKSELQRKSA